MSQRSKPPPPAWGTLLNQARRNAGLSARKAAALSGISEGRWRQICQGYQQVGGKYALDKGPDYRIAVMAAVVGVTPSQLDAAGRPGAAAILAAETRSASDTDALIEKIQKMPQDQARNLLVAIAVAAGIASADPEEEGPQRRYGT